MFCNYTKCIVIAPIQLNIYLLAGMRLPLRSNLPCSTFMSKLWLSYFCKKTAPTGDGSITAHTNQQLIQSNFPRFHPGNKGVEFIYLLFGKAALHLHQQ
jgi:hypothetical protein